jgi:hypothetical protein
MLSSTGFEAGSWAMWFLQQIRMDMKGDGIDLFWGNIAETAMRHLGVPQQTQVNLQHSQLHYWHNISFAVAAPTVLYDSGWWIRIYV